MSAKLIILEEAAAMLGMSPEELTKLRNDNEIFGYRDGKTWKFKLAEIERFANQRDIEMRANPADSVKIGGGNLAGAEQVDIDADLDELIDVAEINLDEPLMEAAGGAMVTDADQPEGSSSSSTIIGKSTIPDELESDLVEAIDSELDSDGSETAVGLPPMSDAESIEIVDSDDSEIKLAEESSLALEGDIDLGGSDLQLAPGSEVSIEPEAKSAVVDDEPLNLADSGSELKLAPGSEVNLGEEGQSDEEIVLSDDEASDMEIDLSESLDLSDEDLEITFDSSSEIDLDGSDLQLEASDTNVAAMGSDITLNAGESGINLATPTDSGISLEQTPSEISVGEEDEILELGEAAEVEFEDVGDDMLVDDVEGLQADDEFLLTPASGDALEESDSGSQVIALDTEELGEDEATILQTEDEGEIVALPDQGGETAPLPGAPGLAAAPETGYSLWNVLSLGTVMVPLLLAGLMMLDLVRHMWTWDEPYTINSTLMDFILSMFGSS